MPAGADTMIGEHYGPCRHWSIDGTSPACGQVRADGSPLKGRAGLHVRLTDQPRRVTCRKCRRKLDRAGLVAPIGGEQLDLDLPTGR